MKSEWRVMLAVPDLCRKRASIMLSVPDESAQTMIIYSSSTTKTTLTHLNCAITDKACVWSWFLQMVIHSQSSTQWTVFTLPVRAHHCPSCVWRVVASSGERQTFPLRMSCDMWLAEQILFLQQRQEMTARWCFRASRTSCTDEILKRYVWIKMNAGHKCVSRRINLKPFWRPFESRNIHKQDKQER